MSNVCTKNSLTQRSEWTSRKKNPQGKKWKSNDDKKLTVQHSSDVLVFDKTRSVDKVRSRAVDEEERGKHSQAPEDNIKQLKPNISYKQQTNTWLTKRGNHIWGFPPQVPFPNKCAFITGNQEKSSPPLENVSPTFCFNFNHRNWSEKAINLREDQTTSGKEFS